jgi:hypothetical protein
LNIGPSPYHQRRMAAAKISVAKGWYIDFKTKEIRHKELTGTDKFVDLVWRRRTPVWDFYWWLAHRRAEADMMPFSNPIHSDNMPIAGFPMKYELQGGWTIPDCDLKYLVKGPLASEGLTKTLVHADIGWRRFISVFRQFGVIFVTVATIAGAAIRNPEVFSWLVASFS